MRDLLTWIGIAAIALLSLLLAAPVLVDFDAYRGRVAEEFSSALGAKVALNGPISLSILPTPRFSAQNFALSGDFGSVKAEGAFFELSLPALMQGRLQFSAARLDGAEIATSVGVARRLFVSGAALQFDALALRNARLVLTESGAPPLVLDLPAFDGQAGSLAGPFKGQGVLARWGEQLKFSLASDAMDRTALPFKLNIARAGEAGRAEFDGRLDFSARPAAIGQIKATGHADPGPWRGQADVTARLGRVETENLEIRLGDGPLAEKIAGKGFFEASGGRLALDLAAQKISGGWASALVPSLRAASAARTPLDLRLAADVFSWRGADWAHVFFERTPGVPARLRAEGPGDSALDLTLAPDGAGWRGRLALKAADFSELAASLPEAAAFSGAGAVELNGDYIFARDEIAFSGAALRFGKAAFSGDMKFRRERPGHAALLSARLTAPALDLESLPDLAGLRGWDLDLSLDAQTARQGGGEPGRLRAHFLREGAAARLERLELKNIGGADVFASGAWGADFSALKGEARLKAANFAGAAQVLAHLAPGVWTAALASRAKLLSPAELTARADGGGKFRIEGALGGAKIAASLAPNPLGGFEGALDLNAPEGGLLLNQLGAPVLLAQRLGPAHVVARARPDARNKGAMELNASAELAGLRGEFRGTAGDPVKAPSVDGDLALSGDAGKALAAFGFAAPGAQALRLNGRLSAQPGGWRLGDLAGVWGDIGFTGEIVSGADGLGGRVFSDRLSGPALLALALGPPAPARAGALWSSLSFAPVLTDPPRMKIAVQTEELQPFGGKASFDLALGPGYLSVSKARLAAFGGVAGGGFDLRREGARVTLEGDLEGADFPVKTPAFSARLGGRLHVAGGGTSAAALIGSLAGAGAAQARDLRVEGAAETGVDAALAATEASDAPFDAALTANLLDAHLAAGAFHRPDAALSLLLASGRLGFSGAEAPGIEGFFDLRDGAISLAVTLVARHLPEGWTAPPPRGIAIWSGAWASPVRRVDSAAFVNAVAARALEREQARIERQKAQDRERFRPR